MKTIAAVLLTVAVLAPAGWASRLPHYHFRTPGGAVHCFITTTEDGSRWGGFAKCSTRTFMGDGRLADVVLNERYDTYVIKRSEPGTGPIIFQGGTTLRADRTYLFRYPWRTGRTMFWVTARRTAKVESLRVRNPEGHGYLLRVHFPSRRTTLVRF
jgi:hypothetical protein